MNINYINPDVEKFTTALFIAIFVHIVVIYSVDFVMPKYKKLPNTTMEIILVPKKTSENVDKQNKADYLAQISQKGGGEIQDTQNNFSTPTIPNFTPPNTQAATSQVKIFTTEELAKHSVNSQQELINASAAKLAKIQDELDAQFNIYTKQPRKKYIDANTKAYNYADYMDTWRRKVEEIGTINYPDKARQQQLSGSLVLEIVLNSNGTIYQVEIQQSSGYTILDEAAIRIVRLAAPFAPFPESIRKETDLLHIIRTWDFRYNSLSSAR